MAAGSGEVRCNPIKPRRSKAMKRPRQPEACGSVSGWASPIGTTTMSTDVAIIFGRDVQMIQSDMVVAAKWLAANVPSGQLVAVHDIGAVGYYLSDHPLVDLAGLITPDVIPFVRDEARLAQYIRAHKAAYLVTSDAWHPHLIHEPGISLVFQGTCPLVTQEGGYSIGVYRIAYP